MIPVKTFLQRCRAARVLLTSADELLEARIIACLLEVGDAQTGDESKAAVTKGMELVRQRRLELIQQLDAAERRALR